MKVYAKYFAEKGVEYRMNTLLQFGDSWELVGSLFLINPGSAKPKSDIPLEPNIIGKISEFLHSEINAKEWREFNTDPTMRFIESLFNGKYINEFKPLNGIIQLFNLFNLREANLPKALETCLDIESKYLYSFQQDILLCSDKKIFLGWGSTGKDKSIKNTILREKAIEIFEIVKKSNLYLDNNFDNNLFSHPISINIRYKKPTLQALLNNFNENSFNNTPNQYSSDFIALSNDDFKKAIDNLIAEFGNDKNKFLDTYQLNKEFVDKELSNAKNGKVISLVIVTPLKDYLEIKISNQESSGYIGVRALEKGSVKDWNEKIKENGYLDKFSNLDLPSDKTWLVKINASEISYENRTSNIQPEIIMKSIMEMVVNITNLLFENEADTERN